MARTLHSHGRARRQKTTAILIKGVAPFTIRNLHHLRAAFEQQGKVMSQSGAIRDSIAVFARQVPIPICTSCGREMKLKITARNAAYTCDFCQDGKEE